MICFPSTLGNRFQQTQSKYEKHRNQLRYNNTEKELVIAVKVATFLRC